MRKSCPKSLGRNFLVENVAGASSNIGTAQAAKAAPDGYTILVTVNNLVINPSLFDKVMFDPYKDFDPVALAVSFSSAFCGASVGAGKQASRN